MQIFQQACGIPDTKKLLEAVAQADYRYMKFSFSVLIE